MILWEMLCPVCGEMFNSSDSYRDTRADIRDHIKAIHPEYEGDFLWVS